MFLLSLFSLNLPLYEHKNVPNTLFYVHFLDGEERAGYFD